ncbi:hypothetical protein [Streptomyces sp. NPDC047525]|uniref:hypothetical protein n=1 Tax=Streptomyces sp. NPDC047525 TaxID=3155264 RepID=UPI0033D33BB7
MTPAQASELLDKYVEVNNKANATRDAALLGTVEGGQLYEQSKADYKLFKTKSAKDQRDYASPFFYKKRAYFMPAGEPWFVVGAQSTGSKEWALLTFEKEDGKWKVVMGVYSPDALPAIDVSNHGLATALPASAPVGGMAPDAVSDAYEDLFVSGGKHGGNQLATTEPTKAAREYYRERNSGKNAKMATTTYKMVPAKHDKTYALKLKNDGAIAMFPTAHTSAFALKSAFLYNYKIDPDKEESVYNSTSRPAVLNEYQGQGLAELTKTGKPKVQSREYRLVDSR